MQSKSKIGGFGASLKTRTAKTPKTEPSPVFTATKTNVADDAIEVVDDSMALGSSKESTNKRSHKKEIPAQNNLRTELGEINYVLASYAYLRERTDFSDEYKKRVEVLTSKRNEIEKKLKRKMQCPQRFHEIKGIGEANTGSP